MNRIISLVIGVLCFGQIVFADDAPVNELISIIASNERQKIANDLKKWINSDEIAVLSMATYTDNDIKTLYDTFKSIIVSPPEPDNYTEYSVDCNEGHLAEIDRLGRKVHNMLFALSNEDIEKYGGLLHSMRDVLYVDATCLPLALNHDNSRDAYWYKMHNSSLSEVETEYNMLFKK